MGLYPRRGTFSTTALTPSAQTATASCAPLDTLRGWMTKVNVLRISESCANATEVGLTSHTSYSLYSEPKAVSSGASRVSRIYHVLCRVVSLLGVPLNDGCKHLRHVFSLLVVFLLERDMWTFCARCCAIFNLLRGSLERGTDTCCWFLSC